MGLGRYKQKFLDWQKEGVTGAILARAVIPEVADLDQFTYKTAMKTFWADLGVLMIDQVHQTPHMLCVLQLCFREIAS